MILVKMEDPPFGHLFVYTPRPTQCLKGGSSLMYAGHDTGEETSSCMQAMILVKMEDPPFGHMFVYTPRPTQCLKGGSFA